MNLYQEILLRRRSIRAFTDKKIGDEIVTSLLEAGQCAPSACNKQPWRFLVVQKPKGRALIQQCYDKEWFTTAQLYIIVIGDHEEAWSRPSGDSVDIDTSIATTQMMLQAHDLGLASTWVCAFDQDLCKRLFHIPEHQEPISILAVGFPDPDYTSKAAYKRKPLSDIVIYENYEE
ncbi:nitroreductase family protein [Porphyromonas pogonae]|uniref:nitroreductase family protein n=1 Tax=Porphyromonas pogonae TaxID=867595 RepID=UPI002E788DF0|nr:nitroreductase family protein [Porphyromonas pogonae]